jgi:hypothetical protein
LSGCRQILDRLGYSRLQGNAGRILIESIEGALRIFGDSAGSLVSSLAKDDGLPEKELLLDYRAVETSLDRRLGRDVGKMIMDLTKRELLKRVPTINPDQDIGEIADEICMRDVIDFVRSREGHEHVLFLYGNAKIKDELLAEFFGSAATATPKGLLSVSPHRIPSTNNMLYGELLSVERSKAMDKAFDWVYTIHSVNDSKKGTRIAGEDASWFFRNGLENEFIQTERAIGTQAADNISFLCSYDLAKIDERHLETIIPCHGFVVLGDPPAIYKSPA